MRKVFFLSFLLVLLAGRSEAEESAVSPPFACHEVGLGMEEHETYIAFYPFWNQLIKNHYFYELRGYVGRNYRCSTEISSISEHKIRNQYLYGGVAIFGYLFHVNPRFFWMPYIRLDTFRNQVDAYKDSLGNEINTSSYSTFLGIKIFMKVNDFFSFYATYYGGYRQTTLHGKGCFYTHHAHINTLQSVFELGAPYFITPSWFVTPYVQYVVVDNNPSHRARHEPISFSGLTVTNLVWAIKAGYAF